MATLEQLNNKISRLEAQRQKILRAERRRRKERRDRSLMRWGIMVEMMLKDGKIKSEDWEAKCRKYLTRDKDLEFALDGLARLKEEDDDETS